MSSPVTDCVDVSPSTQYAGGIWKSPMKTPESLSVSTRVNPVAPNPVSSVASSKSTPPAVAPLEPQPVV